MARDPSKLLEGIIALLTDEAPAAVIRLRHVQGSAMFWAPEVHDGRLWREVTAVLTAEAPLPPTDPACPKAWRDVAALWTGKVAS